MLSRATEDTATCLSHVLDNLPIGVGVRPWKLNPQRKIQVHVHHLKAGTKKWNADKRFDPMPQLEDRNCSVWEVGANTKADDSRTLLGKYPNCRFHGYEPIPDFFQTLMRNWAKETRFTPHNYGIASTGSTFSVRKSSLNGDGTYIGDEVTKDKDGNDTIVVEIKSFDFAIHEAGGIPPTLLHINCEGCEWEMIPDAIQNGFISAIPIIQIGWHNYGQVGLGQRVKQYCNIREQLFKTHELVYGVPFAWERWQLQTSSGRNFK